MKWWPALGWWPCLFSPFVGPHWWLIWTRTSGHWDVQDRVPAVVWRSPLQWLRAAPAVLQGWQQRCPSNPCLPGNGHGFYIEKVSPGVLKQFCMSYVSAMVRAILLCHLVRERERELYLDISNFTRFLKNIIQSSQWHMDQEAISWTRIQPIVTYVWLPLSSVLSVMTLYGDNYANRLW